MFHDRKDAGSILAQKLLSYKGALNTHVVALPRGGVIVAKEISDYLDLPLDIIIPRKITTYLNPEYAIGALCDDKVVLNERVIRELNIPKEALSSEIEKEKREALRREEAYLQGRPKFDIRDKTIILVDDGIATGFTMLAAIKAIKEKRPKRIIVAVPVSASESFEIIKKEVDEAISILLPADLQAISLYYSHFEQTSDEEVISIMKENSVPIAFDKIVLMANLSIPKGSKKLIVFVHGSSSSRKSPRNQFVASYLNKKNLATLLFDLLLPGEDAFDIDLLTHRLLKVTKWAQKFNLPISYFGASTGAAAALKAASKEKSIESIVSRGGRPDLAEKELPLVQAATLLIVGGNDIEVITLNKMALQKLTCKKELKIVKNATHLFEEEGALEEVASLAYNWFRNCLKIS